MKVSRIQAVDHVSLEAPPGVEDELIWFYTEVGRLDRVTGEGEAPSRLCFRSAQLELRIRILSAPHVDAVARRLTLAVPSLAEAGELLETRSVPYTEFTGLWFTDRRLTTRDPAGHRVALKQEWPLL